MEKHKPTRTEEDYFAREEIEKRHKLHKQLVTREARAQAADVPKERTAALLALRRNPEGMKLLLAALDGDPRAADAMLVLADAYRMVHRPQPAVHWYRKYLEIAPSGDGAESARQNLKELGAQGPHEVIRAIASAFTSHRS